MPSAADDEEIGAVEALRGEAAGALRGLLHAYIGHEGDAAQLTAIRDWATQTTKALDAGPTRSRLLLMQRARASSTSPGWTPADSPGFQDRAVAGAANPASIVFDVRREGDTMVTDLTLGAAFEGAPGRAHGGIVAAAFDDFTGSIIGMLGEPAFTGEITVRFVRPVPVKTPLRFRTWLDSRDGRKLHILADAHAGDELVATCRAVYITVDPAVFAASPDPR